MKTIRFQGHSAFSSKELLNIIKTREGKPFNARFLTLDKILLKNYYQLNGYLDVFVEAQFTREGDHLHVSYTIREGRRYYLDSIAFRGNTLLGAKRLHRFFPITPGEPYNPIKIQEGLNAIEQYYLNHGKPFVRIQTQTQTVADSLIRVLVDIQEGETVIIKDIRYEGLRWVKSFIIRREMEIHKGDLYSRSRLDRSQRNIYSTGLFKSVRFRIDPVPGQKNQVILNIVAVEKPPRWLGFRFGVNYEEEKQFGRATNTLDLTLQGGHRNLFGTARSLSASLVPSFSFDFHRGQFTNPKNQISLMYVEPWIGYTRTPGIFQFSYSRYRRPLYPAELKVFSSSFHVRHEFQNYWRLEGTLNFKWVKTQLDTILQALTQGLDRIYAINVDAIRDRRDNFFTPTNGSILQFRTKFVYSTLANLQKNQHFTNRFVRFLFQWNRYQPLPRWRRWTLATRVQTGAIVELNPATQIPYIERFFLGGASSVRGYREQELGPSTLGSNGQLVPLGGKFLILANAEIRIPIFWLFLGEIFIDAGNVWPEIRQFHPAEIKASAGLGMALLTPVGPVRVDWGLKLFPEAGQHRSEFHLGISMAF